MHTLMMMGKKIQIILSDCKRCFKKKYIYIAVNAITMPIFLKAEDKSVEINFLPLENKMNI